MLVATNYILLVFQLILFSKKAELQAPTITPAFSSPLRVKEGESVSVEWNYSLHGVDFLQTRFSIQGAAFVVQKIQTSAALISTRFRGRITENITESFASITFLSVNRTDSKAYTLTVTNVNGDENFDTVELQVQFKPENVQLSTNATGNQACLGSFLYFNCSAGSANPQVTSYQLFENDIVVNTSSSGMWIRRMPSSGVFTYKCLANNSVGTANSTSVNVTSGVASTIQPLQIKTIHEGGNLNLSCNESGTPPPVVSWVRISTGQRFDGSVLKLTNINRNEAGDYRCEASNDCGNESKTTTIHVEFKPTVTIQQCPTSVTEGDNATLYCNATGYPVPNIAWINASSGNIDSPTKTLLITAITRSERGNYICHASNEIGNDTQTCEIDVYYLPNGTALTTTPTNTTVLRGSTVSLNCSTNANPAAYVYRFYFNDAIIGNSSSGVFNITVDADGVYTCVPINEVGTGQNATVSITMVVAPTVKISNTTLIVVEGSNVTLSCNASGEPFPIITWTRIGDFEVFPQGPSITVLNVRRPGTPDNMIQYQCTASNGVESPAKAVANVTVHFPPEIVAAPSNKDVVEGNSLNLFCNATGNPQPDIKWTKQGESSVLSTSEYLDRANMRSDENEVVYNCKVSNSLGFDEANATITVFFAPTATLYQCPTSINESNNATFYCNATGNPLPTVEWVRENSGEVVSNDSSLVLWTINRNESGRYQCFAGNRIGNDTKNCTVRVDYPPIIVKPTSSKWSVNLSSIINVTVECLADGRPYPSYVWTDNSDGSKTSGANLTIEKDKDLDGRNYTYTCTATNDLGYDTRTVWIEIKRNRLRVQVIITKVYEKEAVFDNSNKDVIKKGVKEEVIYAFRNDDNYNGIEDINLRSGSIIASFVILFKTPVTLNEGLGPLTAAVANGTLGPFTVKNLTAIEDVSPTPIPSDSPTSTGSTTAPVTPVGNTAASPEVDGPPWGIIGGAIGAVVVVIIVIILVACWVHKKRKCRKDTKIHNSESEVLQGQNDIEDGVHAKVNGGYADAGPPSANGTNRFVQPQPEQQQQQQQQAAVTPPDYAVVDKSKKKNKDNNYGNKNIPDYAVVDKSKKKKNKKAEVEDPYAEVEDPKKDTDKKTADPSTHDYAVVNKSKKKKKEEDENAYATVDKSKKSKKKPKAPGEVLYADLDDFKPVQAPSMPTVSTSPEPLAPLKRSPSYQATEYADITQFLKGNAKLPEGQSTEMQPTYANAGGGQGVAANKENANTGGERGGGDTEPKETPM